MRTGWTSPADTYSIFVCGDAYYGHNHRDVNGFVIYKDGYLAEEGRRRIYQTAAHNTLLVYVDENDGEQRRPTTDLLVRHKDKVPPECDMGDVVAFETNPHYVYVCGDGSKAYNWLGQGEYKYYEGRDQRTYVPQLESFTRQYLYLLPNTFVVFDRTVALKPEARKVWQLHTVNEPGVDEATATVTATHAKGKLTSITLLPEKPVVKKQFQHLVGAEETTNDVWQITVERPAPEKVEQFLHVIHVGEAEGYQAPQVKKLSDGDAVGAEVTAGGVTYTVTFKTTGPVAGHVTVKKGDQVFIDKDLATTVQPQAGYAESK
jgi:heparin/heparan-sulfate lyase